MKDRIEHIHWLGHDSFRIEGDDIMIYIDPWKLKASPKADLILITHDHGDHCSPSDVKKIHTEETIIVTIAAAAEKLTGQLKVIKPGDELTVKGIPIKMVPAYNINKFRSPGVPFHPKESDHVGFVITVEWQHFYHTGDSDLIPEMESLDVDIALLPVSGTYVMTAAEAVEAASAINPKLAIPMHIGRSIGTMADADYFKENAQVPVKILPMEG